MLLLAGGMALGAVLTAALRDYAGPGSGSASASTVPRPAPLIRQGPPAEGAGGRQVRIEFTPVRLVAPEASVALASCPTAQPEWYFGAYTPALLEQLYEAAGLTPAQRAQARDVTSCTPGGCQLSPAPALVGGLSVSARGEIYRHLADDPRNFAQYLSYRFHADQIDDWFERSGMSPEIESQMRALFYRQADGLWSFSDLVYMCAATQPGTERQSLLRALSSQTSLAGVVHVPEGIDLEPLVRYWSGGGPEVPGVRAALESAGEEGVPLQRLLPPRMQSRLNTYPGPGEQKDLNCYGTALNFFAVEPDFMLLNPGRALAELRSHYEPVPLAQARYGDVLAIESSGELQHAAVYIADGVYLTKNGYSPIRAWTLSRLNEIHEFYPTVNGIRDRLYRRKW